MLRYEIKYRRKGSIEFAVVHTARIPKILHTTDEDVDGIDLTNYTVIALFGASSDEKDAKIEQIKRDIPNAIILSVTKAGYRDNNMIILPTRFNPSRVVYYQSNLMKQRKDEQRSEKILEQATKNEIARLSEKFPEAKFYYWGEGLILAACNLPNAPRVFTQDDNDGKYTRKIWDIKATFPQNTMDSLLEDRIIVWKNILNLLQERTGEHDLSSMAIEISRGGAISLYKSDVRSVPLYTIWDIPDGIIPKILY